MGLGDITSSIFGGGGDTTIKPPDYVLNVVKPMMPDIQREIQAGPGPQYPGSWVAPFSPWEQQYMGSAFNRGFMGSPYNRMAGDYMSDVLGGRYLNEGVPESVQEAVMNTVMPAVNSTWGAGGRSGGSPLHAAAMGESIANVMAPLAFQKYNQERGMQQQMAQFAPSLAREDWFDINQMAGPAAATGAKGQQFIDAERARHDLEQQRYLDWYLRPFSILTGGNPGQQQRAPNYSSPLMQLAGLGFMGASLGNDMGWWGSGGGQGSTDWIGGI